MTTSTSNPAAQLPRRVWVEHMQIPGVPREEVLRHCYTEGSHQVRVPTRGDLTPYLSLAEHLELLAAARAEARAEAYLEAGSFLARLTQEIGVVNGISAEFMERAKQARAAAEKGSK